MGLVKLGISPINARSIMRETICPSAGEVVTTASFVIGKRDFGAKDFHLYDLSPISYGADGCIGMDFLKNHPVYFNFKEKAVYIGQK